MVVILILIGILFTLIGVTALLPNPNTLTEEEREILEKLIQENHSGGGGQPTPQALQQTLDTAMGQGFITPQQRNELYQKGLPFTRR